LVSAALATGANNNCIARLAQLLPLVVGKRDLPVGP
jgi:hypothetical protein